MDYRAPVDSMLFAMRHGAGADRLPGWDEAVAAEVLRQAGRFVEREIAPIDVAGDLGHARLEAGRVRLPPEFARAYRRYRDGGWAGLAAPTDYGGQGLPQVLAAGLSEMLSGACVSFQMIVSLGQGALRTLAANGTPAQCDRYMPALVSGEWLATMCLTEPDAGSDLKRIRTAAAPDGAGRYRITGTKIFISGGDQDMTDNLLHLVLARTPGAPEGLKGLSLFLCPAVLPDGSRNALSCVRLEDKMGLHASPTCQMAFDGAQAELLGAEGEGLTRMFVMMNAQRLEVAVQGVGLAEVAAQRSRAYAAQRRQGSGPGGGAPTINAHPDVRRMLLAQIALAEGCRALLYRTHVELELGSDPALVDFLTPVCKAFMADGGVEAAQLAIQIHGGYGYLREYRVEQILRDARIIPIYEGTNGIQAITVADRLLRQKGGAPAQAFRAEVQRAHQLARPAAREALGEAVAHWERASEALLARAEAGAAAMPYLRLTGLVALGGAWARLEAAAEHAPNPERIRAGAVFFRDTLLAECGALARQVLRGPDLRAVEEKAFAP